MPDGTRFSTHSRSRCRFAAVWAESPRPSTQWSLSHHADEMGARLADPSEFRVEMSTTGVPKYMTVRSIVLRMHQAWRRSGRVSGEIRPSRAAPHEL